MAEYFLQEYDEVEVAKNLNPNVVETAALAHDLGHPPFGHVVEQELDKIIKDWGVSEGFEGNPQSFRVVTQTATQNSGYRGLNLTRASLNAILKYPWARGDEGRTKKWGYYDSDEKFFEFARELNSTSDKSLEAQIMDWADDIAYAVHDVADFYRSGLIPLDQILQDSKERSEFIEAFYDASNVSINDLDANEFLDRLKYVSEDELHTPFKGTTEERASLQEFSSWLVQRYLGIDMKEIGLADAASNPQLDINETMESRIELLKYLTIYYVIEDSTLMSQQYGQREMINSLFNIMMGNVDNTSRFSTIIPSPYRERLDEIDDDAHDKHRVRVIADLLSSMTEQQATQLYKRLAGYSPGSLQDRIML